MRTGYGFDPHDITVFDGDAYFSAVNAEGQDQLWLLDPTGDSGSSGTPFWGIAVNIHTFAYGGTFLNATGAELNGVAGASAAGLDPSNLTALTIPRTTTLVPITEGQLLEDETLDRINPGSATAPAGEGFVLTDTALDIELLTAAEITASIAIGLQAIASTDASVVFTVDMVQALEPSTYVMAPAGDTVTIADYAASIEGMSDAQLSELTEIGVSAITSTDAPVFLKLDQALALTTPVIATATADVAITAPLGDTVVVTTSAGSIEALTSEQLAALSSVGVGQFVATGGSVVLTVAQALQLEDRITIFVPSGDTVTIADTAADIEAMTPAELDALPTARITAIAATDGSIVLQPGQANAITSAGLHMSVPHDDHIIVADTAADVIAMTTAQIAADASLGVTEIATSSGVVLNVAQVDELEEDGISLVQGVGTHLVVTVEDKPAQIPGFESHASKLYHLGACEVSRSTLSDANAQRPCAVFTGLLAELMGRCERALGRRIAEAAYLIDATGFRLSSLSADWAQFSAGVFGAKLHLVYNPDTGCPSFAEVTPANVNDITVAKAMPIKPGATYVFDLGYYDYGWWAKLDAAGCRIVTRLKVNTPLAVVADNPVPEHHQTLTELQIDALPALSPNLNNEIFSTAPNSTITLDVAQFQAYEQNSLTIVGVQAIEDFDEKIATLTPSDITALGNDSLDPVSVVVKNALGHIDFSLQQALAIVGANYEFGASGIKLTAASAFSLAINFADTAADFENLTTAQIDTLSHFYLALGANAVEGETAPNASLMLNVAQAEEATADNLDLTPPTIDPATGMPTGFTLSIGDRAADITGFLDLGASEVTQVLQYLSVSGIAGNDGPVALNVSEAETFETANADLGTNVAITAPPGDAVTLSDIAADIEAMTPAQLGALSSIGVTEVDVTDQSITLTVPQALALYDPVPITVPPGDTVIVADTEAEIDSLTQTEIEGLAAIGVKEIDVSNLTGAGPLTIDGGITLSISGAVPSERDDYVRRYRWDACDSTTMLRDGYGRHDLRLLTARYDRSDGCALRCLRQFSRSLATDPNDDEPAIQVIANGNTSYLDIDPSQVFLTGQTFELFQDGAGTGSGTDLMVDRADTHCLRKGRLRPDLGRHCHRQRRRGRGGVRRDGQPRCRANRRRASWRCRLHDQRHLHR